MARRFPFVFIFLCTALLICSAYYWRVPFGLCADTEADYLDSLGIFRVHVIEPPIEKTSGQRMTVQLQSIYNPITDSTRLLSQKADLYIRVDSAQPTPVMGDILLVRTRITRSAARFTGDFDYGHHLRLQHKAGVGYASSDHWQRIGHRSVRSLRAYALAVQQRLVKRYQDAGLTGRALAFMSAITLGERDALDSELRQSFAAAGAAHVLAVSGLHTGIIYHVIISLLTCFGMYRPRYEQRLRRVVLALVIILAMWAYAFVTGLSPSVLRAVLMLTIVQVGWMCRRDGVSLNTLAAAACICLWADPLSLFNVSFQLSFAAVLGILLLVPHMNSVWHIQKNKLSLWLRDLVNVSLAATIGTLPVTLFYFGQVSRFFLLTNLLIIPAAELLVVIGIAVLVLSPTTVGAWLAVALKYMCSWTCAYVSWIEHLPFSTLHMHATPWMVVCLVAAIVFVYASMQQRRLAWLAPAVACVALLCVLHVQDVRMISQEQALAISGRTLYYKHGSIVEKHSLESRYTFFRFDGKDYVYAPYLSGKKQHSLQQYCREHAITMWGTN